MTKVNPVVQQAASSDSTERLATKTRLGVSSLIGGSLALGTSAAAHQFGGIAVPAFAEKVADFLFDKATSLAPAGMLTGLPSLGGAALALGTAFVAGSLVGASLGKFTAHKVSLNDVKARLGVAGSDLNLGQMHRVADIAVDGGIFKGRSTAVQFKNDAARIRNLNKELTNTEFSLSSNAHNTSKARGTEDRFFDFEGARLTNGAATSDGFVNAVASIKSAIAMEVKATDKYTYQQGNSASALNRREYILAGIMGHAHDRGIAGNFLASAIQERANLMETNPKQADVHFREALRKGIDAGILAPNTDPKCYEGMVNAAAFASSTAPAGKNRDAVISSIFDSLKEAGLIDGNLRARFIKDVREKITNPGAEIVAPAAAAAPSGTTPGSALIDRLFGKVFSKQEGDLRSSLEDDFGNPVAETESQKAARLAAEVEAEATSHVNFYADTLASLDPRQKNLADLYEKLTRLLNEKAVPLDQINEMDPRKLRGAIAMRHKHGFDLFDKYEANDTEIAGTREEIVSLTDELDAARTQRPADFSIASKEERKGAEALEKQVKAEDARIEGLKAKAEKATAKIDDMEGNLQDDEFKANDFFFRNQEQAFNEPARPKEPGFFERLFSSKTDEETVEVEGVEGDQEFATPAAAAVEQELSEPATPGIDGQLPDPVVVETKSRFWN
jgi:hypothetical protein